MSKNESIFSSIEEIPLNFYIPEKNELNLIDLCN